MRVVALVVVLAVAGCVGPSTGPSGPTASTPPGIQPAGRDLPLDAPGAPRRRAAPSSLVGLDDHDVRSLLGRPKFVRRDGPAQIWQYGVRTCTLNLYLFREGTAMRVRHFEFRDPGAELTPDAGCDAAGAALIQAGSR
jgi:hypothetical protein